MFGSSAHTGLVGLLLRGSTFEECCAYLSSKCQRKLGSSSVDLTQKQECRRKLNSVHDSDCVIWLESQLWKVQRYRMLTAVKMFCVSQVVMVKLKELEHGQRHVSCLHLIASS